MHMLSRGVAEFDVLFDDAVGACTGMSVSNVVDSLDVLNLPGVSCNPATVVYDQQNGRS